MSKPRIRLVEGLHLTATNRAHIAGILANGWLSGSTRALSYELAPIAGQQGRYRFTIAKRERDDWGRPIVRHKSGIIETMQERGQ